MDEESIFAAALEHESGTARDAFLEGACRGDEQLKGRVEALLHSHEQAGTFLNKPAAPAATLDQPITEKPGTQIGPYKLREQIGEGGFGTVYVAEQEKPVARKVALKVIKPGMDTRAVVARFEAERQALALMDHPNIARVLDAGSTESGRPYFVMELVKGTSLTEFCDGQELGTRERLQLFVEVCRAVQHAHLKGIIHRDLKPSNVMVTMRDDRAMPKVIDFGVAKALSQRLTEKTVYTGYGQLVGTPLYMSPEQAQMNEIDVDTRSDVYSLGILLYELLTGTTPFDGESIKQASFDELRRIIREDEPPRPSDRISTLRAEQISTISDQRKIDAGSLVRSLRGELDWIAMKALEKDRNRRYESASAFAADVERYLKDEPVQACPPSVWYRVRKFARRKKGLLAATGVLSLALLVAIGGVAASIGWVVRDKEYRSSQLADRVQLVLAEVAKYKKSQDWIAARQANKRAASLLADSDGNRKLKERISQHQKELDFVAQLRDVREKRGISASSTGWRKMAERTNAEYADHFRRFGIDVVQLSPDEAARKIKRDPDLVPIISTILDDWASSRMQWKEDHEAAAKLWQLAVAIDPDPWRSKLRQALIQRDDATLKRLATADDVLDQPPSTLWLLAVNLADRRGRGVDQKLGVDLLRGSVRRYPRDFWLNYAAGSVLMKSKPNESLTYLHTAHALRPRVYGAHHDLAVTWSRAGFPEMAIAEYQEILRNKPNFWWPHFGIAHAYYAKRDYKQALLHFQQAIACDPPDGQVPGLWGGVASTHRQLNQPDKVIAASQKSIRGRLKQFNEAGNQNRYLGEAFGLLLESATNAKADVRPFLREIAGEYPRSSAAHHYLALALAADRVHLGFGSTSLHVVNSRDRQALREALGHIEIACELEPKGRTWRYTHALVREWLGEPPGKVAYWKDAVNANHKHPGAHLSLAWACMKSERWEEALKHLRLAQKMQPDNPDVLLPLCNLLVDCPDTKFRDPEEGLKVAMLCRNHRLGPNDRLFAMAHFRLGNWEKAAQYMKAVGYEFTTTGPIVESLIEATGPSHPAEPGYSEIGEHTGFQLSHYYVVAMANWKLGNETEALDWFLKAALPAVFSGSYRRYPRRFHREAVAVIPAEAIIAECNNRLEEGDDVSLCFARGEAHARLKNDDDAAADFVKALDLLKPGKGWSAQRRVVYQRLAEFPDVVVRVAELRPNDTQLWIEVGRYHASFGRWKQAAAAYGKVIGKDDSFNTKTGLRPSVEFAGVLLLTGDKTGYQRLCQQITTQLGESNGVFQITTLIGVSTLSADNGITPAKQVEWGAHALSEVTDNGHKQAHLLGMAHYRAGDSRKAIEYFEDANIRRGKPLASTALGMALAWRGLGNTKQSRHWYDFGVRLHTDVRPTFAVPTRQLEIDDWITASVLYQEAKPLIEEPAEETN